MMTFSGIPSGGTPSASRIINIIVTQYNILCILSIESSYSTIYLAREWSCSLPRHSSADLF